MKTYTQSTFELSVEDVESAIRDFLAKSGEEDSLVGSMKLEAQFNQVEIPIGVHDCDYRQEFAGIKVFANHS